ncbi:hypothetical protein LPJ56_000732 [Coemansia sp. RSA 2599]|nr:hypothetical protein LPJ56_000732 [Coemansia sp. RSA 2599]
MFKSTFSLALLVAIAAIGASAAPGHASVHRPNNASGKHPVAHKPAASLKLITPMEIVTVESTFSHALYEFNQHSQLYQFNELNQLYQFNELNELNQHSQLYEFNEFNEFN